MKSVIKIDLCKSKVFTAAREKATPDIRQQVLKKLLEISKDIFPNGEEPYPKGSFYKADGDAVYFLLEKPSVALRCAIEFMVTWYHVASLDFPECRVIIDRGQTMDLEVPGKTETVGKPLENISIFEKDLGDGHIYVTHPITEDVDRTMVNFTFFRRYTLVDHEELRVYMVNYLDPRTIPDTSLLHALFVANPKATEARDRVIELFLIEYALEKGEVSSLEDVLKWGTSKGYPMPYRQYIEKVISGSSIFVGKQKEDNIVYSLQESQRKFIEDLRTEFWASRDSCVKTVTQSIQEATRSEKSTQGIDITSLIEEYLSVVFSEIRLMANYFRHNYQIFSERQEKFVKFDYVLKRAVPSLGPTQLEEWKRGFFYGLMQEAQKNNLFIAAVFHNVLATYYLNRSTQISPYQMSKLKTREIYLDTNVLYAFMVPASSPNELVRYAITKLVEIGVTPKIFPFTLNEYEQSLENVERHCSKGTPSFQLQNQNPWLLQEYNLNPQKYQGSMAICRILHSISKKMPITEQNYEELDRLLRRYGLRLETKFSTYSDEQIEELWIALRNLMPSDAWDMAKYWDFIYRDALTPDSIKSHDVHCIHNLVEKTNAQLEDEIGIQTFFLTLDRKKLLRLRKQYSFILSPEQFLEFFLPYLFLADVPLVEPESFPNKLIAAGLSSMLVKRPPQAVGMLRCFLEDPSLIDSQSGLLSETRKELATALSSERFRNIVELSQELPNEKKAEVAEQINEILEEQRTADRKKYYESQSQQLIQEILAIKDRKIEKLQNTIGYWRTLARKRMK